MCSYIYWSWSFCAPLISLTQPVFVIIIQKMIICPLCWHGMALNINRPTQQLELCISLFPCVQISIKVHSSVSTQPSMNHAAKLGNCSIGRASSYFWLFLLAANCHEKLCSLCMNTQASDAKHEFLSRANAGSFSQCAMSFWETLCSPSHGCADVCYPKCHPSMMQLTFCQIFLQQHMESVSLQIFMFHHLLLSEWEV